MSDLIDSGEAFFLSGTPFVYRRILVEITTSLFSQRLSRAREETQAHAACILDRNVDWEEDPFPFLTVEECELLWEQMPTLGWALDVFSAKQYRYIRHVIDDADLDFDAEAIRAPVVVRFIVIEAPDTTNNE
jgi:hypothetical protein